MTPVAWLEAFPFNFQLGILDMYNGCGTFIGATWAFFLQQVHRCGSQVLVLVL